MWVLSGKSMSSTAKLKKRGPKAKALQPWLKSLWFKRRNATLKQIEIANVENCFSDKTKFRPGATI